MATCESVIVCLSCPAAVSSVIRFFVYCFPSFCRDLADAACPGYSSLCLSIRPLPLDLLVLLNVSGPVILLFFTS